MITIHFSLAGIVGMITRPYWPALMDAMEREDLPWIIRSSRKLLKAGLGFGALSAMGLVLLGPVILPIWIGDGFKEVAETFHLNRATLAAFSVYFILHLWRHMSQILVLGMGMINQVVCAVVAEALFLISFTSHALNRTGDLTMIYPTMAGSILLFTGWILPTLFLTGTRSSHRSKKIRDPESLDPVSKLIT